MKYAIWKAIRVGDAATSHPLQILRSADIVRHQRSFQSQQPKRALVKVIDEEDFYAVLGVSQNAEPEVIEAAYRVLMGIHHPDRNSGDLEALRRARSINQAYEVLGDPEKRREYNLLRGTKTTLPARTIGHSPEAWDGAGQSTPRVQTHKRCIECAEEIQRAARKCRYCGAPQDGGGRAQSQATNIYTHVYPAAAPRVVIEKPRRKQSRAGLFLFVFVFLVLLIILF